MPSTIRVLPEYVKVLRPTPQAKIQVSSAPTAEVKTQLTACLPGSRSNCKHNPQHELQDQDFGTPKLPTAIQEYVDPWCVWCLAWQAACRAICRALLARAGCETAASLFFTHARSQTDLSGEKKGREAPELACHCHGLASVPMCIFRLDDIRATRRM